MSAERPTIGLNHPDLSFTSPLKKALDEKGIDTVALHGAENYDGHIGLDALVLQARNGFDVPEDIATVFIDEPTSERERSEWASRYFDEGAAGYFPSSENPRFIAAYMKNILRRGTRGRMEEENEKPLIFEGLTVDEKKRLVLIGNDKVDLRSKEFDLLALFVKNPGVVFTRSRLLAAVWRYDYEGETRTVDVHTSHLRKKLSEKGIAVNIRTVRGIGYGLVKLDKNEGEEGKGSAE